MRAGALRHKVDIEQPITTDNVIGEDSTTWQLLKTVRAQIIPISGKEYFSASQHQSQITHKIRIRYLSGVTTSMRINQAGRLFDIQSVINFQERGSWLEIMATEDV